MSNSTKPGNRARELRKEKNLSQIEIALRSEITPTRICMIERGVKCNQATAQKIAAALGEEPEKVFPNFEQLRRW